MDVKALQMGAQSICFEEEAAGVVPSESLSISSAIRFSFTPYAFYFRSQLNFEGDITPMDRKGISEK